MSLRSCELRRLADYRLRPATRAEVDTLVAVAERRVKDGQTPFDGLKDAFKAALCSPAFLYLAHRVDRKLTGRPTLTVVEEIHALLGRHGFPDLLRTWLLTQRKRNGAVKERGRVSS